MSFFSANNIVMLFVLALLTVAVVIDFYRGRVQRQMRFAAHAENLIRRDELYEVDLRWSKRQNAAAGLAAIGIVIGLFV